MNTKNQKLKDFLKEHSIVRLIRLRIISIIELFFVPTSVVLQLEDIIKSSKTIFPRRKLFSYLPVPVRSTLYCTKK